MGKERLLEEIEEIPLFETIDVYTKRSEAPHVEQEHFQAIVEKGKNDAIAVVSDRYNLVQIRTVFREGLETILDAAKSEEIDEIEGKVSYYRGRGELEVFPKSEEKEVGLLLRNSVDGSYALHVDFCTKLEDDTIVIPEVESFRRFHTCKDAEMEVEEYFSLLSEVSNVWDQIVESLGQVEITPENAETLKEDLHLGRKFEETLEDYMENGRLAPLRFWEFIQLALRHVQRNRYKSEIHYREKIRRVSDTILKWAMAEKLRSSTPTV